LSRSRLEGLEQAGFDPRSGELLIAIAWLAIAEVPIPADELKSARRRAMLVLASGGDPHRDLGFDSVAAERLAGELDSAERREALAAALGRLEIDGLAQVSEAVHTLLADPELAWRSLGLALLADELAEE
jgi:hypothetical protein